jgi:hypothetical protein
MERSDMKGLFSAEIHGTATSDPRNFTLLAMGPLSKQPCTMPMRLVLVQDAKGGFIVYNEVFSRDDPKDTLLNHSYFIEGSYFPDPGDLVAATQRFADRLSKHSNTLGSLYRDEVAGT